MVPLDRQSAPARVPLERQAAGVQLSLSGKIYFTGPESGNLYLFSMKPDGSDRKKVLPLPVSSPAGISIDERWVIAGYRNHTAAYPAGGGPPSVICDCDYDWSRDGKTAVLTFRGLDGDRGVTVAIPLAAGAMLPPLPKEGYRNSDDAAKTPGARVIPHEFATVSGDMYAYNETSSQWNIFQIPIP